MGSADSVPDWVIFCLGVLTLGELWALYMLPRIWKGPGGPMEMDLRLSAQGRARLRCGPVAIVSILLLLVGAWWLVGVVLVQPADHTAVPRWDIVPPVVFFAAFF